jgi:CheY-like chemotaxis protein
MPKHVLVVDDDKGNADLTAVALIRLGNGYFTAEAVYGGQACLDRLEKEPKIDLILLDLNMPGVDGAGVIRAVLNKKPLPDLKIMLLTAWGPDWAEHWNLTEVIQTLDAKRMIYSKAGDKFVSVKALVAEAIKFMDGNHAS